MIVVDTNVVVRLLVADDAAQARRARALFAAESVFVPVTVLLEAEWVLRGAYRLDAAAINRALRLLLGLPEVSVGQPRAVAQALHWHAEGWDFADALHIALTEDAEAFATFDAALLRAAKTLSAPRVIAP